MIQQEDDLRPWLAESGKEEQARQRSLPLSVFCDFMFQPAWLFLITSSPREASAGVSGESRAGMEDRQHSSSLNIHSKNKEATGIQFLQKGVSGSPREIGVGITPIGLGLCKVHETPLTANLSLSQECLVLMLRMSSMKNFDSS